MSAFQELINAPTPVLIDFYAEWCGPCKQMAPELKKLVDIHGPTLRVIKVDVDKNPEISQAWQISGVPTLMLFREGKLLWRQSGAMSAHQLSSIIQSKLAS